MSGFIHQPGRKPKPHRVAIEAPSPALAATWVCENHDAEGVRFEATQVEATADIAGRCRHCGDWVLVGSEGRARVAGTTACNLCSPLEGSRWGRESDRCGPLPLREDKLKWA